MTSTTNLQLEKQAGGQAGAVWGADIPTNWDEIDARFGRGGMDVRDPRFGAVGDYSANDTAAFAAARDAAGVGGTIKVPGGTYDVRDLTLLDGQVLKGTGRSSILKAGSGAAQALRLEGRLHIALRNFTVDGNAKASKGLVIKGGAAASSQGHELNKVRFQFCSVGTHVAQGTVSQADKNTYTACYWADNDTSLWVDSPNAQEQYLVGGAMDAQLIAVRLTHGTVTWVGGQVAIYGTAFLIDGVNVEWLNLKDIITEQPIGGVDHIDIDGTTNWPVLGVVLEHCVLQGTDATVKMGVVGSKLTARNTRFNTGNIEVSATDCLFIDENNEFTFGAAWNPTGGAAAANARITTGLDGIHYLYGGVERAAIGYPALTLGEIGNPSGVANKGIVYTRDNGSGKSQLCVQFGTGAPQVIATEP